jgi:hypothetical protein
MNIDGRITGIKQLGRIGASIVENIRRQRHNQQAVRLHHRTHTDRRLRMADRIINNFPARDIDSERVRIEKLYPFGHRRVGSSVGHKFVDQHHRRAGLRCRRAQYQRHPTDHEQQRKHTASANWHGVVPGGESLSKDKRTH